MLNALTSLIPSCTGVMDNGDGSFTVGFSGSSRPATKQEIAAAQAEIDKAAADKEAIQKQRQAAKAAIADLQVIIDGIDGATLAQAKAAIKQLAQICKGLIKAVVD